MKRDNQKLAESVKNLREENEQLLARLKSVDDLNFQYESQVNSLQKMLNVNNCRSCKVLIFFDDG